MVDLILTATDANFDTEVLASDRPVLVDFWAEWCAPCRAMAPVIDQIAKEYDGKVKVAKLNVDENMATSTRYNIRGIPTMLLFKDGQVKEQIVGATSQDGLERVLSKHLS